MDINLDAFHFLRPQFLYLIPAALLLTLLWHVCSDPRRRWRGVIAPHLLANLLVDPRRPWRLRPIHGTALALMLIGVAAAGPTWEQEPPPFSEDTAPMVVVLDLSRSMDAVDVPPTRLERAKQKVRELMKIRPGSRTGLVVYAGSAHLVLPPTDDPDFMGIFLDALDTSLMPKPGKNAAAALQIADQLLARETAAGSILFFTDGFEPAQTPAFVQHAGSAQLLILAVGTAQGGPLRSANGRVVTDATGRPQQGRFDKAALQQLAHVADIPLAGVTLDAADVKWVQRRALSHMQAAQERHAQVRWKEAGYDLTFPLVLLAAFWFRRGWVVRWLPAWLLLCSAALPQPASALDIAGLRQPLLNAFMTPDQQGRWYFEQGDYAAAAAHFADPQWQGRAYYQAGDYTAALTAFARQIAQANSSSGAGANGFFMLGNCYARLKDYPHALVAYNNALKARPAFPEALTNRGLVAALIPKPKKQPDPAQQEQQDMPPDEIKFDNKGDKSKQVKLSAKQLKAVNAELWMRNLQTTPADFLRQKFLIEAQTPKATP